MTILHLSSEKTWRGGEQQLAYLLEELPRLGARCLVACRSGSAFEDYCQRVGQAHVSLPFANELDVVTAWRLKQYCRQQQVDVVHAHSGHSHALAVWSHLLGNNLPIVLHRKVDFPVKDNPLSRYKYNYPGIRKIICVSDMVKQVLSRSLDNPSRCVTIYDGIDPGKFPEQAPGLLRREFTIPADTPLIANVAALSHQKDPHTFIDTAALLKQAGTKAAFFLIGEGHLRQELEEYARSKGMAGSILFTGFRNDIPLLMPELDLLLFTSRTEGLGSTILDAFACRVPVVATAAGGIPELITHNQTGLLAPVGDAPALAAHVSRLLREPDLAKQLTEAGWQKVQQFHKATVAAQTLRVYQEIL